jgi:hypothetical protein
MLSESGRIIARRFTGRIAESGLLVLAVALGVGAASSGFSLLANAVRSGKEMISSPGYRELVASARTNTEEMAVPAIKKATKANAALTAADLDAASMAPSVVHSYVRNRDGLQLVNAASIQREEAMAASFQRPGASAQVAVSGDRVLVQVQSDPTATAQKAPAAQGAQPDPAAPATARSGQGAAAGGGNARARRANQDDGPPGFRRITADDLKKAQAQADIVIVDGMDRLNGFSVTPQFFDAWSIKAAYGSLLTSSDASGTATNVVLGSEAAIKVAGSGRSPADLVGKKILTREGYAQVVGVLAPTGDADYDDSFFSSYRTFADAGFGGPPRNFAFNTQLRFAVSDPSKLDETEKLLAGWFAAKIGEGQISISNPRSEAQKLIDRNAGIGLLILFLSLSGLFIALVNVSHILMSRGLRMRKGVGIMMALGASRASVMRLFALEATAISATGAVLGGAFALPLSRSMQAALGLEGGSWLFVALGVLASWALTLAFSIVPAWQNSRIVPADAMRAA